MAPTSAGSLKNPSADDPRALPLRYALVSLALRDEIPAAALRRILETVGEALGAQAGSIALPNPDSSRLEIAAQMGAGDAPTEVDPDRGIPGWCVLHRKALLVPDVRNESRPFVIRSPFRCILSAPMLADDQVVGVIELGSDRPGGFTADDLALLEVVADEASRVMQRLWRLAHLHERARQLESLLDAGRFVVTKLEEQDLFATLAREARRMMQVRSSSLHLHDSARETVRCVARIGGGPNVPVAVPLGASLFAPAIRTRRQIWFANVRSAEFRELADLPVEPALRSLLATPLIFEGEVLGVLAVFTDRLRRFDNHENRLCAALAGLGAVALQNARLYRRVFESEDVLHRNERLTTLGTLAAEIAHEIRNPLTVLKLLHGGLGLEFADQDPRRTDSRVISEKLDQLETLVGRVLSFAQSPSQLHSRWALTDIIEDTLVLVRLKLAQGKVTVEFRAALRPFFVSVDKGQLQQVLLNLLLNALHAMPDGGSITLTVAEEERPGGRRMLLDVADTGTGVPEAIRGRIFDSFLSGRPGGTGLGLAVAKRILLGHHGDIVLHQTSPAGTTMRVVLPLV